MKISVRPKQTCMLPNTWHASLCPARAGSPQNNMRPIRKTIGMALPPLMKALWKGNLIHQQQLRLGAPCHYQLSAPSLMFSSADAEAAWHTALLDKSTPSASQSPRALITSVQTHIHTAPRLIGWWTNAHRRKSACRGPKIFIKWVRFIANAFETKKSEL